MGRRQQGLLERALSGGRGGRVWRVGRVPRVSAGIVLLLTLVGCAAPSQRAEEPGSAAGAGDAADLPPFDGPWAESFAIAYQSSGPTARAVLEDEQITDREYSAVRQRIVHCMAGLGLAADFDADGALRYDNPERVEQAEIEGCMAEEGLAVLVLRDDIARNPKALDEPVIMVECLRRAGVIDAAYTPEDYAAQRDVERIIVTPEFAACDADPFGGGG